MDKTGDEILGQITLESPIERVAVSKRMNEPRGGFLEFILPQSYQAKSILTNLEIKNDLELIPYQIAFEKKHVTYTENFMRKPDTLEEYIHHFLTINSGPLARKSYEWHDWTNLNPYVPEMWEHKTILGQFLLPDKINSLKDEGKLFFNVISVNLDNLG